MSSRAPLQRRDEMKVDRVQAIRAALAPCVERRAGFAEIHRQNEARADGPSDARHSAARAGFASLGNVEGVMNRSALLLGLSGAALGLGLGAGFVLSRIIRWI